MIGYNGSLLLFSSGVMRATERKETMLFQREEDSQLNGNLHIK